MKVYKYLRKHSPYQAGDQVKGRIYEISGNFGVFVAVDDQFSALIPRKEAQGNFSVGEIIDARVTEVKEDGKLDLSVRKKAYLQMEPDSQMILERLKEYKGILPFDDRADPEVIKTEFGISKAAFKRAVGHLLKEKIVEIKDEKIFLLKQIK